MCRCRSTRAGLARSPATCSRRPRIRAVPLVGVGLMYRKGYFRQRIDASGWQHEYWVDTDPERLPAALVTGPAGRAAHRRGADRERSSPRGSGASRSGACRCSCSTPTSRRTARSRAGSRRGCTTATPRRGCRSTRCSASAGSAPCGRWATSPGCRAPQRGPRRARAARAPHGCAPGHRRWPRRSRRRERTISRPTPRCRPATTPTRAQEREASAGSPAQLGSSIRRARGLGAPTMTSLGSVRRHPGRAALSRAANAVSRRHGEVAREMWNGLWPERRVDDVPIGQSPTACMSPPGSATDARAASTRHLPEGWLSAADPHVAAVDAIPDAELWAARVASARPRRLRAGPHSPTGSTAGCRVRHAAARRFEPDALTSASRGGSRPTSGLSCSPGTRMDRSPLLGGDGRCRSCSPARRTRRTRAKHQLQRLYKRPRSPVRGRVAFVDDYDLHSGAAPRAGLRRVAEPTRAAARGERHERHEVGGQRRPRS